MFGRKSGDNSATLLRNAVSVMLLMTSRIMVCRKKQTSVIPELESNSEGSESKYAEDLGISQFVFFSF